MNPCVYDIAMILQTGGVGTFATDIFVSKEPNSPDACITLYSTGGLPSPCLDTNVDDEICYFQVRVRNNDYLTAYSVLDTIQAEIQKAKYKTVSDSNGTTYYSIWSTSTPIDLARDTTNRCVIVQNYACLRYQS